MCVCVCVCVCVVCSCVVCELLVCCYGLHFVSDIYVYALSCHSVL